MANTKKTLFLIAMIVAGGSLFGQQPDLPSEQVDVVKSFDARLMDAERITVNPDLPPLDTTTRRQTYNIVTKTITVEYLPPKIRPLAMRGDNLPESFKGYAKLGAGFPGALYGEASYNVISNKNLDLGIHLFHNSANNNRNVENQRFANTFGKVNGTYYFDQGFAVNGRLGYSVDNVFFYGYNDLNKEENTEISFAKDDVMQKFSIFDVGASIFNGERTEADFNYSAGFDAYLMQDDYAARERGFDLNIGATKWFNDAHPLTIKLRTDFTAYKDTADQSLNNFYLQPSFTYHADVFKVKIGANIASHEDEFAFFPDLEATASIIPSLLSAFIGAEGSLQKNTFRSLSDYNPFISSRIRVRNTRYYHFFGGIKGNVLGYDYNAQVGYKTADDLALFLLGDPLDSIPRFDVLYDSVDIFSLKLSVSAPIFEGFELIGTASQSFFTPKNEEKAWHLPTLSINVAGIYTALEGHLRFKGEFFLENGVPYRDSQGEAKNLNALFDISLGVEYFFTKNIGLFANINNLANNRRQRWHRYPVFGLNALAGVTARF
jgi:hypothetical protein